MFINIHHMFMYDIKFDKWANGQNWNVEDNRQVSLLPLSVNVISSLCKILKLIAWLSPIENPTNPEIGKGLSSTEFSILSSNAGILRDVLILLSCLES